MSIESVMPSKHLILCRPLLLLPPIPPSIRVFSNESALHIRWPKYWSFSVVSVAIYIHSNNFYIHTLAQMYLWSSRPIYPTVLLLLLLSRFSRVRLCVTPQTAAHQAPLSLGFSRQEHWSGLPFSSPVYESEK